MEDKRKDREQVPEHPPSNYDPRRKFAPNEVIVFEDDGYEG